MGKKKDRYVDSLSGSKCISKKKYCKLREGDVISVAWADSPITKCVVIAAPGSEPDSTHILSMSQWKGKATYQSLYVDREQVVEVHGKLQMSWT